MAEKISMKPDRISDMEPFYGIGHNGYSSRYLAVQFEVRLSNLTGWADMRLNEEHINLDEVKPSHVVFKVDGFDRIKDVIDVDMSDIVNEYISNLPAIFNVIEHAKRTKRVEEWNNHWFHEFISDSSKKSAFPGTFEIRPSTLEEFLESQSNIQLFVIYKGVHKEVQCETDRWKTKTFYYIQPDYGAFSRCQRYTKVESLLSYFVSKVQKILESERIKKEAEVKRRAEIKLKLDTLNSLFAFDDIKCIHEERTIYPSPTPGSRQHVPILRDEYWALFPIERKDDKTVYGKISLHFGPNETYGIGSFSKLSARKVREILTILSRID